jgi:hypothetical protein
MTGIGTGGADRPGDHGPLRPAGLAATPARMRAGRMGGGLLLAVSIAAASSGGSAD